jgi:hypothetical protein
MWLTPNFLTSFSCILKKIYIQENIIIIFSLSILGFKFLFSLQHLLFSIQEGLYFIILVSKTSSLKLLCGGKPALAPLHSQVPMKSLHPCPYRRWSNHVAIGWMIVLNMMINSFLQHPIQIQLQEFPNIVDSSKDIGSMLIQILFGIIIWGATARASHCSSPLPDDAQCIHAPSPSPKAAWSGVPYVIPFPKVREFLISRLQFNLYIRGLWLVMPSTRPDRTWGCWVARPTNLWPWKRRWA